MKNIIILLLLLISTTGSFCQVFPDINPDEITIARDEWGVPHIFAKTDAAVAFGLAWANAEDNFSAMQELLLISKQMMGRKDGVSGAPFDFFVHSIGTEKTYQEKIGSISDAYKKYIDGYCQGINAFAAKYPEEILVKNSFPILPEDVLKAYLVGFAALSGSVDKVANIMNGNYDKEIPSTPAGSNAYAFSPHKTTNSNTFLCMNPHFKIDGGFSFYEAHLMSDEGMNITGTLFQGGTCIFIGNNNHLGWGKTYNHVDQVDVFELEMHPTKKLYYKFDDTYVKLEKRPVWLKVRLGKSFVLPVKKMTYWSKYGPTYKSPAKRFFSVRSPSFFNLQAGEQYYEMNKATNLKEFKGALEMNALSMFNIVYADKEGNIFYICNSMLPKRNPDFDYSKTLIGNTSENLWNSYYSQKELPQELNPDCGFVFNTNNTPRHASCALNETCDLEVFRYSDLRSGENNRSTRFMELVEDEKQYSFEEFIAIKFDTKMSKEWIFWKELDGLRNIDSEKYPPLEEAIKMVQTWDGDASKENKTAALFMLVLQHVFKKKGYSDAVFTTGINDTIAESLFIEAIEKASMTLIKQYGTLKVPLGEVVFHERNGKLHPASGFPDALAPIYTEANKDGKQVAIYGDTYIHFVEFDKEGAKNIQTLLPFEKTRTCEDYIDELEMYNNRKLKTMSLDKAYILKNAVKTYHPN